MKKLLALMLALCGVLTLTGCTILEKDFPEIMEEEFPIEENWESITFKSISGGEDLVVSKTSQNKMGPLSISTSNYEGDYMGVAVYSTDCEACKAQAPYLNKLAKEFNPLLFDMDFAIVFLDLYEDSDIKNVEWAQELEYVKAYTNVASTCAGGACKKVFIPNVDNPTPGTIYYVNKANVFKTRKSADWDLDADPENLYQGLRAEVADFLDLDSIYFDPSVGDWIEHRNDVEL
ncbi:MAG: hypothetical protein IKJ44_01045 [Elusimicrobiaceae bacterium]|nr:hypothetical protein [Elusimicrobiaceae bacterium]